MGRAVKKDIKIRTHPKYYTRSLRLRESQTRVEDIAPVRACGKMIILPVNGREISVSDYDIVALLKHPKAKNPGKARLGNLRMRISQGEELPVEERHTITRLIESIEPNFFKDK